MIKRILVFLDILVLTIAAYTVVNTFYRFVQSAAPENQPVKSGLATAGEQYRTETMGPYDSYGIIAARDLFQTAKPRPVAAAASASDPSELPTTALNLKLLGTLSAPGGTARAIIEDAQAQKQGLYKKGDSIQNAVIKTIKRNMVVVTINGQDEILLPEEEQKKRMASKAPVGTPSGGPSVKLSRAEVEQSMRNIGLLMTQARWQPSFDQSGNPEGIAVNRIRPGSLISKMGMSNGDVLQSVNGKDIRSMDDIMTAYTQFRTSDAVQFQVKRGDAKETLAYSFE